MRLARHVMAYRRTLSESGRTSVLRFGLFLPREDVYSGTPDVDERIADYLRGATVFSEAPSVSCPLPIIRFDEHMTNRIVAIERGYPAAFAVRGKNDPRANARLKKVLQALGKLRE